MKTILLGLLLCITLAACGEELKFDGSTDESAGTSMERMTKALPPDQAEKFGQAYISLVFQSAFQDGPEAAGTLRKKLNGLTATQIIALAPEKKEPKKEEPEVLLPTDPGLLLSTKDQLDARWGVSEKDEDQRIWDKFADAIFIYKTQDYEIRAAFIAGKVHCFTCKPLPKDGVFSMRNFNEEEKHTILEKLGGLGWEKEGMMPSKAGARSFDSNGIIRLWTNAYADHEKQQEDAAGKAKASKL